MEDELISFDGTKKLSKIGGNTVLGISLSCLKALAVEKGIPLFKFLKGRKLPVPLSVVVGGGLHAGGGVVQEFLVCGKSKDFFKNASLNLKAHELMGEKLRKHDKNFTNSVGLEGGWATSLNERTVLKLLRETADELNLKIGIDAASSTYYKNGYYAHGVKKFDKKKQISFIQSLINDYGLFYVEDPLEENDFSGFSELTKNNPKVMVCGDDLFVTNSERLKKGSMLRACNSCILKPNQVGSLKKTLDFAEKAKTLKYSIIASHRSRETNDDWLSDLSIGLEADYIKIGIRGGERVSKINKLLRLE